MDYNITQEVLDFLKTRGVDPKNLYDVLNDVLQQANVAYWETCQLSVPILYMIKDVVWYNMEHLSQGGNEHGPATLRYLGTKFPVFAKIALDDVYIDAKDIELLDEELNQILQLWSSELWVAKLNINSREALVEKPEHVLVTIYNNVRETPISMGYSPYNRGSAFLEKMGHHIIGNKESILCELDGKIGEYQMAKMYYNTLITLNETTKRARSYNKGVRLDIT